MPVYKNDKNGTWYAIVRYKDWTGQNKQKCQRGFATRREALEWEAQFKLQNTADIDMTLEAFYELYEQDDRPREKRYAVYEKKIDKVSAAGKPVAKELAVIRKNAKQLPSILGSDPSVKISEKDFNHLMDMAQASGTLEKLNEIQKKQTVMKHVSRRKEDIAI